MSPSARSRARGFTLVDTMVACAIAGVLAAVALPSYRAQIVKSLPPLSRRVYRREMAGAGRWQLGVRRYQAAENLRSAKVGFGSRAELAGLR